MPLIGLASSVSREKELLEINKSLRAEAVLAAWLDHSLADALLKVVTLFTATSNEETRKSRRVKA